MHELMIVNPRPKRRSSAKRRPMTALQRKYFGGGRRSRAAPRRKARRTRSVRRTVARRNPVATSYVASRHSRRRSSRSANGLIGGFLSTTIVPAGIGALGAMAVDLSWSYLPLPDALKTGPAVPLVRIGAALAVGAVVGMMAGKRYGAEAAAGGILVTLYDTAKNFMQPTVPATPASVSAYVDGMRGIGWYSPARSAGAFHRMDGMNAYVD